MCRCCSVILGHGTDHPSLKAGSPKAHLGSPTPGKATGHATDGDGYLGIGRSRFDIDGVPILGHGICVQAVTRVAVRCVTISSMTVSCVAISFAAVSCMAVGYVAIGCVTISGMTVSRGAMCTDSHVDVMSIVC
jgi:hypothetical protein